MPKLWFSPRDPRFSAALWVYGLGFREELDGKIVDRPQGTRECLVMCFHDPVDLWLDGRVQRIAAGHSMLWTPHRRHYFGRTDCTWSHTWMYADGALAAQLMEHAPEFLMNRLLPPATEPVILKYIGLLYDELLKNAPPDPFIVERQFELLIRELTRVVRPDGISQPVPEVFQQVRQYIEANLHRRLYLADLARVANLSISRLSAEFQRWFHVAPMQYLHQQRMRRATILLLDHDRRISDVAFELGFEDPLYFTRQFTKQMGQSPSQYRRRRDAAVPRSIS